MLSSDVVCTVNDIVIRVLRARGELYDTAFSHDQTWNSLASVEIVLDIEAEFGIRLDTRELVAARTISSMSAAVARALDDAG